MDIGRELERAMDPKTKRIRELNDNYRRYGIGNGRTMITTSVQESGIEFINKAVSRMRSFDAFTGDNNPHGEHDFGAFEVDEVKCFFKFDYYDLKLENGSADPSDPTQTIRVLTLMLAEDY